MRVRSLLSVREKEVRTRLIRTMCKDDIYVVKSEPLKGFLRALNNTVVDMFVTLGCSSTTGQTYCFRDRPMELGPGWMPQKSFVVMTRSVRRKPNSLITRPLGIWDQLLFQNTMMATTLTFPPLTSRQRSPPPCQTC